MFIIIVDWKICGSTEEDQHIGPFLSEKDAIEWGHQIIGHPEGLPWSVIELTSTASAVKQFKTEGSGAE